MEYSRIIEGYGPNAIGGKDRALIVGCIGLTKRIDGEAVAYHILHAVVDDTVGMVYTDGGSGIIRACNLLGLNYELPTPAVDDTNAVAERYVHHAQDGMEVLL